MGRYPKFRNISDTNKNTILEFEEDNRFKQLSEKTIKNYTMYLCKLGNYLKDKTFKDTTKEDIKTFLDASGYAEKSKVTVIIALKTFYRWLFNLEKDERLPDCIRWLKLKNKRDKEVDEIEKKLVSEQEYQIILKTASGNIQLQAMIETLNLAGCRISELLSMNVNDVFEENGVVIVRIRKSKTQARKVPLSVYPEYLMRWVDNTPKKGQPNEPLWINQRNDMRVHNKRLTLDTAEYNFRELMKRTGINKRITPHCFRHSVATRDLKVMKPTHVCTKLGWIKGSEMVGVYDHNDYNDLLEVVQNGKTEVEPTIDIIKTQKDRLENQYKEQMKQMQEQIQQLTNMVYQMSKKDLDAQVEVNKPNHMQVLTKKDGTAFQVAQVV